MSEQTVPTIFIHTFTGADDYAAIHALSTAETAADSGPSASSRRTWSGTQNTLLKTMTTTRELMTC